jgi:hypothetical protein
VQPDPLQAPASEHRRDRVPAFMRDGDDVAAYPPRPAVHDQHEGDHGSARDGGDRGCGLDMQDPIEEVKHRDTVQALPELQMSDRITGA